MALQPKALPLAMAGVLQGIFDGVEQAKQDVEVVRLPETIQFNVEMRTRPDAFPRVTSVQTSSSRKLEVSGPQSYTIERFVGEQLRETVSWQDPAAQVETIEEIGDKQITTYEDEAAAFSFEIPTTAKQ